MLLIVIDLWLTAVTEEEINRALEEGSDLHHPGDPDLTNESPPEDETSTNEAMLGNENDNAKAPFANYNTNTNANPAPTATHPTTDSATTSAGCSASVEPSSDDGDDKDEEEDSGVEASVNRLLPERSKGMPSAVKSHAERLKQTQQESVKLSWEETKWEFIYLEVFSPLCMDNPGGIVVRHLPQ